MSVLALLVPLLLLCLAAPAVARGDAAVTLHPASGEGGSRVVLRGSGFDPGQTLLVQQQGKRPLRVRATRRGAFRAKLTIRPAATGAHWIRTTGAGKRVVNHFMVAPRAGPSTSSERATSRGLRLRWTPSKGPVGAVVELRGSGFKRGGRVQAFFGRAALSGARAAAKGDFAARVVVPARSRRRAELTVRSGGTRLTFPFEVTPDPVIAAAGDIACDPSDPSFNGGEGTPTACRQRHTADVIPRLDPVALLVLGDLQYMSGHKEDFDVAYGPTWGRFKDITWPVLGNHDNNAGNPFGYFSFFGPRVGSVHRAFYSYDVGAWHLIALNSNYETCGELSGVDCADAAVQEAWLRADLAEHRNRCVLAYFHHPRFSSGYHGDNLAMQPVWEALHAARADLVLSGHDHDYERFAPQDPSGAPDPQNGIREFVIGTGGVNFRSFPRLAPHSEVRNNHTYGVLELTLRRRSYDWNFVPEAGRNFSDVGSGRCH